MIENPQRFVTCEQVSGPHSENRMASFTNILLNYSSSNRHVNEISNSSPTQSENIKPPPRGVLPRRFYTCLDNIRHDYVPISTQVHAQNPPQCCFISLLLDLPLCHSANLVPLYFFVCLQNFPINTALNAYFLLNVSISRQEKKSIIGHAGFGSHSKTRCLWYFARNRNEKTYLKSYDRETRM